MQELTDHDRIVEMHTHMIYVKAKIKGHCKKMETLEERIDKIESWRDKVHAGFILIGTGVGGAWAKLSKIL